MFRLIGVHESGSTGVISREIHSGGRIWRFFPGLPQLFGAGILGVESKKRRSFYFFAS